MGITTTTEFNMQPERNVASFEGKISNLDTMRRKDLWDLADNQKIPYPDRATKNEMISIINGYQHTKRALEDAAEVMKHSGDGQTPLADQVMKVMNKAAIKEGVPSKDQDDTLLLNARIWELRQECKKRKIPTKNTDTSEALRAKLGVRKHEPSSDDNKPEQSRAEEGGSDTI